MKLLLHTCCAPCLSGSRLTFEEEGFDLAAYWYNPNIHPFKEYERRYQTLQRYLYLEPMELITENGSQYSFISGQVKAADNLNDDRETDIMTEEQKKRRCRYCYITRLERCAEKAKELDFDGFSTTMLLSRHQDHEGIRQYCRDMAEKHGVEFIYRDLRKRWKESVNISRSLSLYRQPYCGCIFSEKERYSSPDQRIS